MACLTALISAFGVTVLVDSLMILWFWFMVVSAFADAMNVAEKDCLSNFIFEKKKA
jgi:hypothetical protein